ncbi:MAG: hypothetical protein KAJ03_06375 [Gammaproteobacteria bacterium]|nr:hypothetical protein [Gammaproteobacteria bacterium]
MDKNQYVEKILIDREHRFWKNSKSVHDQSESAFTMNQNGCSRCVRISVHVEPEYAIS